MNDRKSLAIVLGALVGVAAVGLAVGCYRSHHCREESSQSVGEIVDAAKKTVRKLDEAVEILRRSATA